jgi:phytoene desaturase
VRSRRMRRVTAAPRRSVAILGAGPAGASLAAHLARRGHEAVLFDGGTRPALVVGESLVPAVVPFLRALGIEEEVAAYSTFKPGATFVFDPDDTLSFTFEEVRAAKVTYSYNVPRDRLDESIRAAALRAGARLVREHARVEREPGTEQVRLAEASLAASGLARPPDFVVDAGGRGRAIARLLALPSVEGARRDTALHAHLEGVPLVVPGNVHTDRIEHGWCWRIPLPGRVSVGLVMDSAVLRSFGDGPEEQFDAYLRSDRMLRDWGVAAKRISPVLKYTNYQLRSTRGVGPGWALLGDAFGFVDPIFSSGLLIALDGALALADALDAGADAAALRRYEARVQRHLANWQRVAGYFYDGRLFTLIKVGNLMRTRGLGRLLDFHFRKHMPRVFTGEATTKRPSAMRFHEEAARDRYDAIVVGSGLGGLTAAALLARAGRRVLVVERHDRPGGYAHAFRRRRYRFDSAVHLVGGCEPVPYEEGGVLHRLLAALGVERACAFVPIDPCYRVEWPGLALDAPCGLERWIEAHADRFPREEKGIRGFAQDCLAVRLEASRAGEDLVRGPLARPDRFPILLRYRRATLAQVLAAHVGDPPPRAARAALWPYHGLPPSRVSFLYFATMLMSYVADGAFYCRGTFQTLVDALVAALVRCGGELVLRSPVRRIVVEGGRVAGVVLENGQRVAAPLVVSNADARQTVDELVGAEHFPARFRRRLGTARASVSAVVVYAATALDLRASRLAHETFLYAGPDHEDGLARAGEVEPRWLSVTVPTLADPSLAPAGEHLLVLTTLVAIDPAARWQASKPRLQDALLARAEQRLPGLLDSLRFAEAATPRTLERYTRNTDGAIYGFDVTPKQVGPGRLDNQTPLPGLLLAGHWTRPGGGVVGVVRSGLRTARLALGLEREAELGL